jgi:hypothetical protein
MRIFRKSRGALAMSVLMISPSVAQSDPGDVTVSVGGGLGQFEAVRRSCDGEVLSSRPVEHTTFGAQIDVRLNALFRITGFGGTSSVDGTEVGEGEFGSQEGAYGGVLLAAEWDRFGLGAGWARFPGFDLRNVPMVHLRIGGEADHLRADLYAPSPTPGVMSALRLGYGFSRERVSGLVGVGAIRAFDEADGNGGLFVDVAIPLRPTFDLTLKSSWHASENYADWGAAVGARLHVGR